MFRKILIANRGEIACRITRTARRLGIGVVAVYSDADRGALHVSMADEAVRLGAPPAAESYLRIDRLIEAARATGAEAIHPGYGFLSENPEFADACDAAGIVFVGPPASAIRALGLKDTAKRLMEKAGVPVIPGYHGLGQDDGELGRKSREIGFPVLIKASAGGGGKGMRRVETATDFAAALDGARREARSSFGDDRVIIEKYLPKARHIEVQIFADRHGNAVHLFERDCSLQRRHQKVIEEAPAPGMSAAMRDAMGTAAVNAAKSAGYCGAGTVEFLADASDGLRLDRFYFIEMNTRLQVEHRVTEAITGFDLVEWQLRVAAGEPLPATASEIALTGHAVEARLYAEDPARDFLPSTGRLDVLVLPASGKNVRVDSGVREGDEITPFYDPMIAKVVARGGTRDEAFDRLASALAETAISGCRTNLAFLRGLLGNESVRAGQVDTGLIGRHLDTLVAEPEPSLRAIVVAAIAERGLLDHASDPDPWGRLPGWRHWPESAQRARLLWKEKPIDAAVAGLGRDAFAITIGGHTQPGAVVKRHGEQVELCIADRVFTADIRTSPKHVTVMLDGEAQVFTRIDDLAQAATDVEATGAVVAPLPGVVRALPVTAGQDVAKGAAVVVLEAMKMEHTLRAPFDGVVAAITIAAGDLVKEGTVLLRIDKPAAGKA